MESIYGPHLPEMQRVMEEMETRLVSLRRRIAAETGMDPVEHCLARIKSDESMREKCRRQALPETADSAVNRIYDAIGFRIVCAFLNDVYMVRDYLAGMPDVTVITEKDYIRHAKPNGYRSYHMVIQTQSGYYVEFQIRTISMDTWAALEHHMKYKKQLGGNIELITAELKRCAEELASTDVSMQTLRDMILEGGAEA